MPWMIKRIVKKTFEVSSMSSVWIYIVRSSSRRRRRKESARRLEVIKYFEFFLYLYFSYSCLAAHSKKNNKITVMTNIDSSFDTSDFSHRSFEELMLKTVRCKYLLLTHLRDHMKLHVKQCDPDNTRLCLVFFCLFITNHSRYSITFFCS